VDEGTQVVLIRPRYGQFQGATGAKAGEPWV
jgi:hypothetical protein